MGRPYFDDAAIARQVMFWSVATLDRFDAWDKALHHRTANAQSDPAAYWTQAREHHLVMVCARNTLRAVGLIRESSALAPIVAATKPVEAAVAAIRDVLEHWDDHLPEFSVNPRGAGFEKSGKKLVALNDTAAPFSGGGFTNKDGSYLVRGVLTGTQLVDWLNDLIGIATTLHPGLKVFVPVPRPTRWFSDQFGQWPLPADKTPTTQEAPSPEGDGAS